MKHTLIFAALLALEDGPDVGVGLRPLVEVHRLDERLVDPEGIGCRECDDEAHADAEMDQRRAVEGLRKQRVISQQAPRQADGQQHQVEDGRAQRERRAGDVAHLLDLVLRRRAVGFLPGHDHLVHALAIGVPRDLSRPVLRGG